MAMSPKVSVIIPCYKAEEFLDECVESVLAQTLQDFEIILVDDESPDRVPEMCDAWVARDARIRVLHKTNEGLGMACNSGLDVAKGRYVAFLDSDDWVDSEMYEAMYVAAEQYKAQMVFSGLKRVGEDGRLIRKLTHKEQLIICRGRNEVDTLACDMVASEPHIAEERSLQMSAKVVLYCRDTIEKHRVRFVSEREIISEDLHFNISMLACSSCVCVLPSYFYNYRCRNGSITQQINPAQFDKIKHLYGYALRKYKELGISGDMEERLMRLFVGYTRQYTRMLCRSRAFAGSKIRIMQSIVRDSLWKEIWVRYPICKATWSHKIYLWLMYKRCAIILVFLLRCR